MTTNETTIKKAAVYCGSSMGFDTIYREQSRLLAVELAVRGIGLVYGGARVGLMGVIAETMLEAGAEVIGVIPRFLVEYEIARTDLTELVVVESMAERKRIMLERADCVIVLPGGYGTLDEIFETLTEAQLGLHCKPCGFLNTAGYYDHLVAFLDTVRDAGFLRAEHREFALCESDPAELITTIEACFRRTMSCSPGEDRSDIGKWQ